MSIRGMLSQWASAIKFQISVLVKYKTDLFIISLNINLFSPWYRWNNTCGVKSDTQLHGIESDTQLHGIESDTLLHGIESDTLLHGIESDTLLHGIESDTLLHGIESDMQLLVASPSKTV
jgi:hypothetical protein